MKLATFQKDGNIRLGALTKNGLLCDLQELGCSCVTMNELIQKTSRSDLISLASELEGYRGGIPLETVSLLAPIPEPFQHVICIENNYCTDLVALSDFQRSQEENRQYPYYTFKRATRANDPGGIIPSYPGFVEGLDYGVELAVIIGQDTKRVSEQDALQQVFGYTVLNDVTAVNLVARHKRSFYGKSLDGFLPMGPWITTAEEFGDTPPALCLTCTVNGVLRQSSNTAFLKYSIPFLISDLSQGMTLKAGSIIATGTPGGRGKHFSPPRYLQSGDLVVCEIQKIGRLINRVGA